MCPVHRDPLHLLGACGRYLAKAHGSTDSEHMGLTARCGALGVACGVLLSVLGAAPAQADPVCPPSPPQCTTTTSSTVSTSASSLAAVKGGTAVHADFGTLASNNGTACLSGGLETVTVTWGDGTTSAPSAAVAGGNGRIPVSADHVY